jgi:hypothetical protein
MRENFIENNGQLCFWCVICMQENKYYGSDDWYHTDTYKAYLETF